MAQTPPSSNTVLPAVNAAVVNAYDVDLPAVSRAICLATTGALSVVMEGGQTVVFPNGCLAAGLLHPIRIKKINSSGTTIGTGNVVILW